MKKLIFLILLLLIFVGALNFYEVTPEIVEVRKEVKSNIGNIAPTQ